MSRRVGQVWAKNSPKLGGQTQPTWLKTGPSLLNRFRSTLVGWKTMTLWWCYWGGFFCVVSSFHEIGCWFWRTYNKWINIYQQKIFILMDSSTQIIFSCTTSWYVVWETYSWFVIIMSPQKQTADGWDETATMKMTRTNMKTTMMMSLQTIGNKSSMDFFSRTATLK